MTLTETETIESVKAFSRPLVVLESPYSGAVEENVRYARECLHDCIRRGEAPIASHLLFTQPGVLDDDIPDQRQTGIDCGVAWIRRADYSVFYTDRGWSLGMLNALYEFSIKRNYLFRIRALHGIVHMPQFQPWLNTEITNFLESRVDKAVIP